MFDEAYEIYKEDGVLSLVKGIWGFITNRPEVYYSTYIRPHSGITDTIIEYNGVRVCPYRKTDQYFRAFLPANQGGHQEPENYEHGLAVSIEEQVCEGDTVVVVGGGLGVTAIISARKTGSNGEVIVYEGSEDMIEHLSKTLELNEVPCQVRINHGIVSVAKRLDGHKGSAKTIHPEDLPPSDVLEMDCEGAEVEIIPDLDPLPETIIVETHGNKEKVKSLLNAEGYNIVSERVAEIGSYKEGCQQKGVYVLTGEL